MAEQLFHVEDNFPDFAWDPESGICPPDRLSLWHTDDLATAIRLRRYANQDTEEVIRVAIAGDTGLYAISLIEKLTEAQDPYADGPLHLEVFDADPNALATATRNIDACGRYMVGFSANIFQADWNEDDVWHYLRDNPVHFLISNPPFLPTKYMPRLREPYSGTSERALDGGEDGLDHVRTIVGHAPSVLISNGPTGVFIRYSYHSNQKDMEDIIEEAFANGTEYQARFRSRYGAGPSSLGQEGLSRILMGEDRILATANVDVRPVKDFLGEPIHSRAADISLQHAAILGGTVLSNSLYLELRLLRQDTDMSFTEEQLLVSGMRYMIAKMGHRYTSLRELGYLPGWEHRRLSEALGARRFHELQDAVRKQS